MSNAQPAEQSHAHVASCAAAECRHNSDGACHADAVEIRMDGEGRAVCGTYAPEQPKARP